ncbi:MAG: ribosomal-processing cysteine protease Prp [Erysipelotrichaceae bacterium]|nr:ribosomal-processing cysteine protease Prp [Erysipelotrichaceae bacterium]
MIKVKVTYQNKDIVNVEVTGHAEFDEYGKDLVCAGVSTLVTGIANTLYTLGDREHQSITLRDGYANITIHSSTHDEQLILETLVISLETMQESYGQYIEILKKEA